MQAEQAAEISAALNSPFWRIQLPEQLEREFEAGTVVTRSGVLAMWLAFPLVYGLVNLAIDIMNSGRGHR